MLRFGPKFSPKAASGPDEYYVICSPADLINIGDVCFTLSLGDRNVFNGDSCATNQQRDPALRQRVFRIVVLGVA